MGMMDDIRSRHKRRQAAKNQPQGVIPQAGATGEAGAVAPSVNVWVQSAPTAQATRERQQETNVDNASGARPTLPPNVTLGKHGEMLRATEPAFETPKPPSSTTQKEEAQPQKKEGQTANEEAQPKDEAHTAPKRMSYLELFERTTPYKPPTDEQREQERKRERRQKLFSAIGDGLSAMANLYATTQGSPGVKQPSLSEAAQKRWDKHHAERKALEREYEAGRMRAVAMDEQKEQAERQWRTQLQKQQQEAAYRAAEYELKLAKQQHQEAQAKLKNARENKLAEAKIKDIEQRATMAQARYEQAAKQHKERMSLGYANLNERKAARLKDKQSGVSIRYAGGVINIPKDAANTANVAGVYNKIPKAHRPWFDLTRKPSREEMMNALGEYLETASNKSSQEYKDVVDGLNRLGATSRGLGPMAGLVPSGLPSEERPKMGYGDGYDFEYKD